MEKKSIIIHRKKIGEANNKYAGLLKYIEQCKKEREKRNEESLAKWKEEGSQQDLKPYPEEDPQMEHQIVVELDCKKCGKICGSVTYPYQVGIDVSLQKRNQYSSLCNDCQ